MDIRTIAALCHAVNREYCRSLGDFTQPTWDDAPAWQRESAIDGVDFHMQLPDANPSSAHNNWMALKLREGWKYGAVKNAEKKTHPCIVDFDQLPLEQQVKDVLIKATIDAVRPLYRQSWRLKGA